MAMHAPITGAPTRAIPLPPVLAFIAGPRFAPRDAVERLIQAAIDALDLIDGDPDDQQDDGDALDGNASEDDFMLHWSNWLAEPGCPVSDPGGVECRDFEGRLAPVTLDQTNRFLPEWGA